MPDPRKPVPPTSNTSDITIAAPAPLWTGTGLCCEAQGDGIPCQGTNGECETCGKALPRTDPEGR
jgi:hypothetical protein